jgi:polysaccharide biosynthesis protein VpsJ
VAVQVGRRTGARLRRVLRVPQHEEPKALADFLRAAAMMSEAGSDWARPYVERLARRLAEARGGSPEAGGWGIGFPYVSRFVNVDTATPNAYTTICVAEALLDAAALTAADDALAAARAGCRFLLDELGSFEDGGSVWRRYWPGSDAKVLNVQAMAASFLARAATAFGDEAMAGAADVALATTIAHQRPDGSWYYSADRAGEFIDGFHTGFVLQALAECAARRLERAGAAREALERGLAFFRSHLMSHDGLPLDFAGGKPTNDVQSVAQCVQTLVIAGDGARDTPAARHVWEAISRRHGSMLVPATGLGSLRWSTGPAALAAAHLVRAS